MANPATVKSRPTAVAKRAVHTNCSQYGPTRCRSLEVQERQDAAPLTQFIASYSSPEGLFWAKLSAASTMAIAPILVLGWFAQKQLVRGLTFGAVK